MNIKLINGLALCLLTLTIDAIAGDFSLEKRLAKILDETYCVSDDCKKLKEQLVNLPGVTSNQRGKLHTKRGRPIMITHPLNGDIVPQRPPVRGTVGDSKAVVWVIVHPVMTGEYWVQPRVAVSNNRNWHVYVYIGRPGAIDKDQAFEIRAVANSSAHLQPGQVLYDWPHGQQLSDVIVVTRR